MNSNCIGSISVYFNHPLSDLVSVNKLEYTDFVACMPIATNQVLRSDKTPSVSVYSMKSEIARAFVESLVFHSGWHYGIILLCLLLSAE